jgi:hypothetical protein
MKSCRGPGLLDGCPLDVRIQSRSMASELIGDATYNASGATGSSGPSPAVHRRRQVQAVGIMDRFRLDGRVAVVTGASSGLGVAFARAQAEAGADVALGARRVERLLTTQRLVEEAGRRAITVATDVSRPEDCQALVDATVQALGRVDILVNNAGIGTAVPALSETPDQFRQVIDVNLSGCYSMARHARGRCGRGAASSTSAACWD